MVGVVCPQAWDSAVDARERHSPVYSEVWGLIMTHGDSEMVTPTLLSLLVTELLAPLRWCSPGLLNIPQLVLEELEEHT
jgi:hypothetical protein